ncbi:ACT domain-containing protein [Halieaceae bacterium IMCC14734]|uniref:Glycine cleavage system transcriptional repressor n=1 Tax=Candidatus Litorirhabdus singularis TaxID=2518993 RepID=A0ABT3TJ70_9GAMM|nr:ACT domain-containing protein [Candidatus Litorirhabdus singularis]MCX2981464.1 ACT domain-containing protein [Candidatus Litorirhabdus singularis]
METSFIITFIGDDRPGLVEELSAVISDHQGNWLESRLSQLAGKFAGLIRVSLPSDRGALLEDALKQLSERGLSVRVHTLTEADTSASNERAIRLSIMGPDRPGIVREIASALARQAINVIDMHSDVSSAPMSAEQLFTANVEAEIPASSDLDALTDTLEQIANDMSVDVNMDLL